MARISLSLVPPEEVAQAAREGLALRKTFGRGGTEVGLARGHQLAARELLTPEIIFRMHAYFARHSVDKKGKNFYNTEKPSNGYIAWQLWGGDAGKQWADDLYKKLKAAGVL